MAEPALEHHVAGLAESGVRNDGRGMGSHPLLDCVPGRIEVARERPEDVALGEDAGHPAIAEDERGADVMRTHDGGGLRDGRSRLDRHELARHHVPDRGHDPLEKEGTDLDSLAEPLLEWFETRKNAYPWRGSHDPYEVLVSEVMLQQTQAARVVPAFERFLGRFPTVVALARASRADVVRVWDGLGYNRRPVALSKAARAIVRDNGGRVPADPEELKRLPGIGPYTAAAVASFAYGAAIAAVDTNVRRVVARARLGREPGEVQRRTIDDEAGRWLDRGHPAEWNQALMDLGREVCRPEPRCEACPIAADCRAGSRSRRSRTAPRRAAPFEDSMRQVRGGIVRLLRRRAASVGELAVQTGFPVERIVDAVGALVRDGLLVADAAARAGRATGRVRLAD